MTTTLDRIADIVKAKGAVPEGCDPYAFAVEILPLLGSTDGKLREWRVFGILHLWTTRREMTDGQIRELLWTVTDADHLFSGIGETGTDSVFMRSFSVLLLTAFVVAHRERTLFSTEDVRRLHQTVLRYLDEEADLRGFVSAEKLWAHGAAHAADAIGELAECSELTPDDLSDALVALGGKATTDRAPFVFEEDARLAAAAVRILGRGLLPPARVATWAASLAPAVHFNDDLPFVLYRYVNARNFLRCLLFQGEAAGLAREVLDPIRAAHATLAAL